MRDRKCVVLVLYDLPVLSPLQRRNARVFRKHLMGSGYRTVQKSVYVKLLHNDEMLPAEISSLKRLSPKEGTVNAIPMSLSVFENLTTICGENFHRGDFSNDLVIL